MESRMILLAHECVFRNTMTNALRIIQEYILPTESLGGVESLTEHPVQMTHGTIPEEERAALRSCNINK
jgi:cystathionine beta-lyase/cystathionine gamma-synthase